MRKVTYPSDIKSLKNRYIDVFSGDLPTLEVQWGKYKSKYKILQSFDVSVKELLTMEYEKLVEWYIKYTSELQESERDKLSDTKNPSLYTECFNYSKYYEKIKAFFLDETNGFDFHVCHYCETSYINSFTVNEDDIFLHNINSFGKLKILKGLKFKKIRIRTIQDLIRNRPFSKVADIEAIAPKAYFRRDFFERSNNGKIATFDLDHVLDKASCPLVALSLFNFVPSCQVCNSRIKHSGILGLNGIPDPVLSPTCKNYNFDREVKIRLNSKNGNIYTKPLEHKGEYEIEFHTSNNAYQYEVDFFKLKERYNYHIAEALHILELKQKYNDSALELISSAMKGKEGFSIENIKEDLLGIDFHKSQNRCFEKLYRDVNNEIEYNPRNLKHEVIDNLNK